MIKSPFTKEQKKKVKADHKKEQRLDPTWFEAKRVKLGSEILSSNTPNWGGFNFKYLKKAP